MSRTNSRTKLHVPAVACLRIMNNDDDVILMKNTSLHILYKYFNINSLKLIIII